MPLRFAFVFKLVKQEVREAARVALLVARHEEQVVSVRPSFLNRATGSSAQQVKHNRCPRFAG